MKFGLIVPTLNAGNGWPAWLDAYNRQSVKPVRALVIDSESSDDTVMLAKESGFDVKVIERCEFDHGRTRQQGVSGFDDVDACVFLTQDAILADQDSLKKILVPFQYESVAAVCGRQLPRKAATPIEAHARLYNYTSKSSVRSLSDASRLGLKTAFLSNSFAAYRVSALNQVAGFPENAIFGEDMYVAAKLLKEGYKIAYAGDACVYHSHDYSLSQDLKRYFDMGVFHAREPWIRQEFGTAEREGLKFVVSELKYLAKHAFWRIPESLLRTAIRLTGFRLGLLERHIPLKIKRKISLNPDYFKNE